MGLKEKVMGLLGINRTQDEFELLETEKGAPGFLGGWKEEQPKKRQPEGNIDSSLDENIKKLRRDFRADINSDAIFRSFYIGGKLKAEAVFMNGMADGDMINDFIIREGMRFELSNDRNDALYLLENVFSACDSEIDQAWNDIKQAVSDGKTAIFIDGEADAIVVDTRGYEHRSVSAPENEKVVKGPKEGFNENLRTNITLLRRLIRREDMVCEFRKSGGSNRIMAAVVYIEGNANPSLVNEVKKRIAKLDTRMIFGAGVLEQLTEKHSLFPFSQILSTERPDRAAAHIMQGYVVVLLEGSPFANIMPTTLLDLMASPEDIYLRRPQGTTLRVTRYLGAFLSVILPAYFLALVLFHQGMMSTEVLSTVVASRKMVFAPIGPELLFLLAVFQLIREAGLRVPGSIGQAIGIIGGLILGQAAVSANLASSVILIVVALAGLGNFCIPDYSTQIAAAYIRGALVLAAWLGGLLGLSCALLILISATASMKSYGVPFLSPVSPKTYSKRPAILRGKITRHTKAEDYTNTKGAD